MSEYDSQSPKGVQKSLTLRVCALLSLFVAVGGGVYLVVSFGVSAKEHDSLILNVAGRQRMLTQKYAREINQVLVALAASDSEVAAEMMGVASQTAGLYEATLAAILEGGELAAEAGTRIQIPPAQSADLVEQLNKTRTEWENLRRTAALAMRSNTRQWEQHLEHIGTHTAKAVAEMDRATLLMQQQSEAKLRRVQTYMAWSCGLGALLFVGTVAFVRTRIVVPLANAMANLSATNDGLEGEILQREMAEAALREHESTLRSILETAADGIIVIDERGSILTFNSAAEIIFGHASAEVLGRNISCLMPRPFADEHDEYIGNFLDTGIAKIIGTGREVVGLRKDGSTFPMEVAIGESQLGGQKIFSGIVRDLEQERRKDERLGRHLKVFHEATDPIVIADLDGRMIEINNEVLREYGYSREELLGKSIKMLAPPEHHLEMDELLECCRAGEKVRSTEVVRRTKTGEVFPALLTLSVLTDDAGQPTAIASFVKDISEFKNLQEQLLQAQKLEAIAILAGGIAHDFNNLLTSIRGSSEILIDHLEPSGRLARSARRIQKATDRATALTTRILGFSRKQVTQRVVLNLNQTVHEIRELFERTLSEDVEFKTDLSLEALNVRADESQLAQVLMNLVVNAGDAMPTGGRLLLMTTREEIRGDRARVLDIAPGRYVALRVRDSGQGIPAEMLTQIFDPFFTTKEVGEGTGLGLSTADGIIREHGGAIAVESEVGVGTLFTIMLPEVEAPPIEAEATSETLAWPRTSGETILLVEDDDIMREVVGEILEEEEYVVVMAADPNEALALSHSHDGEISLVVTDVVMPIMSGFLLAKELRKHYPHIRILYMSGYTDQVLADRGDLKEDDPFIRKPFGVEPFVRKVREVLDSRPRGSA